ncbi:MAG: SLC13 family permease [Acidimicrobiales bacterium]
MTTEELIVVGVLLAMFVALVTRRVSPPVGVVGALIALYISGVADQATALSGFSSPAPATIAGLYVVAGAVERSGALRPLSRKVLGEGSMTVGMARLSLVAASLSAVVANTPIVAMFIGPVSRWGERRGVPPSRFLMPLSFAAILGGMLTLIGTSTNLVASDLVQAGGAEPFGLLEPARLGLPVVVIAMAVVIVLGPRLLPERGTVDNSTVERPFTISLKIADGGELDGQTVTSGGLRQLGAVYLVAIERRGELTAPVSPEHLLRAGDVLTFAGQVDHVVELENVPGLDLAVDDQILKLDDGEHAWFEAVVGAASPLVGQTLKQSEFRNTYQAAVVALHRSGEGVVGGLGDARVQVGDSLLLVADAGFRERYKHRGDFLLVQRRSEPPPTASIHAKRSLLILALVAVLALTGLVDVMKAAVLGAAATVAVGALTPRQARDSVDLNVVILVAAAIGVGGAADSSGLAARLATGLIDATSSLGTWGLALGLVLATIALTEMITNAGAVSLMIPIAMEAARAADGDVRLFALGVTLAASASFLTPIGYQTNTMVYGPGRYHFTDYLRLGIPLTFVVIVITPILMSSGSAMW